MLFLLKCCFVHLQLNQSRGEMHADIESDRDQRRKIFFFFSKTQQTDLIWRAKGHFEKKASFIQRFCTVQNKIEKEALE